MSVEAHLAELKRRHHSLHEEISKASAHSSADDLKVAELKRRKLRLKDEVERLRPGEC
jgi:hypothetical protein